ncbi:MAG: glycosyl transferase family 4 [Candidatus ainarchaeum sp.]|nr:glycosyl transferase family 4 [Candidatus ainarchaeum sp.]
MSLFFVVIILVITMAFFVPNYVLPLWIARMKKRGMTGKDINKINRPEVAELGGIPVWLGFSFAIMIAIFCSTYLHLVGINLTYLLAGLATIIIIGFLGAIDDLIGWKDGIRQWQHALIPLLAALPLMAIKIGNPAIKIPFIGLLPSEFFIPFFGIVSFGVIYSLFIVPIGVTGASNATNMLAGLNGLEAGMGAIMAFTLLIISILYGQVESTIIAAAMFGALIAFLRFNWYPAKVFGGDSLTLMIGASIATIVILGNMEKIGVLIMAIYFVELVLKARYKMQVESFGVPQKNGVLKAPVKKSGSLTHVIMKMGNFTEKQVVLRILTLQVIVSAVTFLVFFLRVDF